MVYNIRRPNVFKGIGKKSYSGAIRKGDWKYMKLSGVPKLGEFLYNLKDDPNEETNLAKEESMQTKLKEMKKLFRSSASSMVPADNPKPLTDDIYVDEKGYIKSGWCKIRSY